MPLSSILIIVSFVLVAAGVMTMSLKKMLASKYAVLVKLHYIFAGLAGLVYLLALILIIFDGQGWNKFKVELLIPLVFFILAYFSAYYVKKSGRRFWHYLMVALLVIVIIIMHLKWSYVI